MKSDIINTYIFAVPCVHRFIVNYPYIKLFSAVYQCTLV